MTTLTTKMPVCDQSVSISPVFHSKYLTPHFNGVLPVALDYIIIFKCQSELEQV